MKDQKNSLKFGMGLLATVLFRVIPLPVPNVEPIMAATLPYSKRMGALAGMAFAFVALVCWDLVSGRAGMWTVYTGIAYAAIGYAAGKFFASRELGLKNRLGFAAAATLAYDAVTALAFGWQFGQPLAVTVAGQVPFTAYHLLGNLALVAAVTPALDLFVAGNPGMSASAATRPSPVSARKG